MYSYIILKYAMYQGNFTNPFVLRYDVENACHASQSCMVFQTKAIVRGICFNVKTAKFYQNDITLLLFSTAMLIFH